MPRTWELSCLITDCRIWRSPSERSVSRWLRRVPIVPRICVILSWLMSRSLPGTRPQHPGGGDILQRKATARSDLLGPLQTLQSRDRGVHDVDRIVAAQRLGQDVIDASALKNGADRATSDDSGTGGRGAQ